MKKLFMMLCALFMAAELFAINGAMSGSKGKVKVIHLEHFDVIYAEESQESAQKIAEVCEQYYKDITDYLAFDPQLFLPVTITRTVEQLNAYFTHVPYNRIVLFDTAPDSTLDMFEDTLPKVFYHELTHAITMNMKSPFWQGVSAFFGDVFTPVNINLTSFWEEGATVSLESLGEGGRLNDSFSTQLVTAAKVLDAFPGWRDVTGARDTYPGGSDAYYFGGMFARYLVEKYGVEKYSAFWQRAGRNPAIFSGSTTFKGTYERSLDDEWEDFKNSIYVPAQSQKNFEQITQLISHPNSFVRSCDVQGNGFVYFDSKANGLYDSNNNRLLSCIGVEGLRFSDDGKLMVHRYVTRDNPKYEPFIYSLTDKKVTQIENTVKDSEKGLYSRIPAGDGSFFAIEKNSLDFSIVYLDKDLNVQKRLNCGKNRKLILHNLHSGTPDDDYWNLTFTWTELGKGSGMVSRTGRIAIDKHTFNSVVELQSEDMAFGAVDYFVEGQNHYVVVQKYEEAPLYRIDLSGVSFEKFEIQPETLEEKTQVAANDNSGAFKSENYSPLSYYTEGIFLPVKQTGVLKSNFEYDEDALGLGATYVSSNPWGDKLLTLSGAVFIDEGIYAAGTSLSGGNESFKYNVALDGNYYASDSFGSFMGNLAVSETFWTGLVSRIGFTGNFKCYLGKNYNYEDDDRKNFVIQKEKATDSRLSLFWTNTRKSMPKPYFVKGITFEPFIEWEYRKTEIENNIDDDAEKVYYANCGASLTIQYPVLLPVTLSGTIYPNRNTFAEGYAQINLVDVEIQKGIPVLPVYFDRMLFRFIYSGEIAYDSASWFDCKNTETIARNIQWSDFSDCIIAKLSFVSSLNTGYFATSSSQMEIYGFYKYRINNPGENDKHVWGFNCAIAY